MLYCLHRKKLIARTKDVENAIQDGKLQVFSTAFYHYQDENHPIVFCIQSVCPFCNQKA